MIGSHDTMTYLPTKQWYLKPFKWMAKCQSKSLNEQFEKYDVRLFDFRVKFKDEEPVFAHGLMQFKGSVTDHLDYLNSAASTTNTPVYARIILESNSKMKNQDTQELLFIEFCEYITHKYTNLKFFGGRRKYDWKVVYDFGFEPNLTDRYSSTTNIFGGKKTHWTAILDDFWPWLYARLNNKKNIKNLDNPDTILFIDFVNIR